MFINNGSHVDVIAGRLAGRFGVVQKIRIEDKCGDVWVFVDIFNVERGGYDLHIFQPQELKGRKRNRMEPDALALIALEGNNRLKVAA